MDREREVKDDANFLVWELHGNSAMSTNGILERSWYVCDGEGPKGSSSLDTLSLECTWDIQVVMSRGLVPMSLRYWSEIPTVNVDLGIVNIGWYLRPKSR